MKTVPLQFGQTLIEIEVPDSADVCRAAHVQPLANPAQAISKSLADPIAALPLHRLAAGKSTAAIVVSDNTRPVPYKDPNGILTPIITTLKLAGVDRIKIIVATGTHRPMSATKLRDMLPDSAFLPGVEIINHNCTDKTALRSIGCTSHTGDVTVNTHYLDAELKILTGLVEPHFMAGVSGGRKSICPGICGQSVTYGFHSAEILNHPKAATMVLHGNPCHEEALQIAKMAGADFIVNAAVDGSRNITGVFAGQLEKAHQAAVEHLKTCITIPLQQKYDLILTQAGEVGINHYQCAKAVHDAVRALASAGKIILIADLSDADPIGGQNYKQMLRLIARIGSHAFLEKLLCHSWSFVPEQWQAQMWARVFIGLQTPKQLYICAPQLETCPENLIPEVNAARLIKRISRETDRDFARRLARQIIDQTLKENPNARVLILPDGPYAVPSLEPPGKKEHD